MFACKATIFASLGLASGVALSTVWPTEVPFGPGEARATITLDGNTSLDAGAVGLRKQIEDTPEIGPLKLGVTLKPGEIPTLPGAKPSQTQAQGGRRQSADLETVFSSEDERRIQQYGELYRSVSTQSDDIKHALGRHLLMLSIGSSLFFATPYVFRHEIVASIKSKPVRLLVPTAALAFASLALPTASERNWEPVSDTYAGTPLEGVEVSGAPAEELVNRYGERIISFVKDTDAFYSESETAAREATVGRTLLGQRPEDERYTTVLFFTDNHCNVGMPSILAMIADKASADLVLDGGDTVFSGSSYEDYCVQRQQDAFRRYGLKVVQSPGNHDSPHIADELQRRGAIVLDGNVVQVTDLTMLGDADPRSSEFASGLQQRGDESLSDVGAHLTETACVSGENIVLLVHDKRAARQAVESGCVDLALTGHTHKRNLETVARPDGSEGFIITGGSSGGAEENSMTYGPLQANSQFMLLSIDNGLLRSMQDFTLTTNGDLVVGQINDQPIG
ncbi:metallophosphatase family protein [Candidatus Saccharibacteria bacterium]|nr:metallophosphatase family protein [Candidatus Saccharibacteria bacterium]